MSKIIKNEDGTESEVFTPEDVAVKLQEKEAELTKGFEVKIQESTSAIEKLTADKKAIEDKIAAGGGAQSENFKTLKEALDKKDVAIADMKTSIDKINETRTNDYRDGLVNKLSRGDKELEKKILHHFSETLKSVPAGTQEEISKKIESAYKLSVDVGAPNILQSVMSGAGGRGYMPPAGSAPVEFSSTEKALGAKMGISDADYAKYGPRLKNK